MLCKAGKACAQPLTGRLPACRHDGSACAAAAAGAHGGRAPAGGGPAAAALGGAACRLARSPRRRRSQAAGCCVFGVANRKSPSVKLLSNCTGAGCGGIGTWHNAVHTAETTLCSGADICQATARTRQTSSVRNGVQAALAERAAVDSSVRSAVAGLLSQPAVAARLQVRAEACMVELLLGASCSRGRQAADAAVGLSYMISAYYGMPYITSCPDVHVHCP